MLISEGGEYKIRPYGKLAALDLDEGNVIGQSREWKDVGYGINNAGIINLPAVYENC